MKNDEMSPIEKAQETMRIKRESGEEIERLNPGEKSLRNPKSLRLAINGKCWDCSGGVGKRNKDVPHKRLHSLGSKTLSRKVKYA